MEKKQKAASINRQSEIVGKILQEGPLRHRVRPAPAD